MTSTSPAVMPWWPTTSLDITLASLALLKGTQALLADVTRWTMDAFARNVSGGFCGATHKEATCWSLDGALILGLHRVSEAQAMYWGMKRGRAIAQEAHSAVTRLLVELSGWWYTSTLNDEGGYTEVMDALAKGIDVLGKLAGFQPVPTQKTYVGVTRHNGPGPKEIWVVEADGSIKPLFHHVKHSPDGFNWGYLGSGPSEAARCLLMDATGGDTWYQDFKAQCVALWPQDLPEADQQPGEAHIVWTMTAQYILEWVALKGLTVGADLLGKGAGEDWADFLARLSPDEQIFPLDPDEVIEVVGGYPLDDDGACPVCHWPGLNGDPCPNCPADPEGVPIITCLRCFNTVTTDQKPCPQCKGTDFQASYPEDMGEPSDVQEP